MEFQVKVLFLSFLLTTILSFVVIPILKRKKVGQMERDDGPQSHLKKQGTPTMGGIIIIISMIVVCSGLYLYYTRYRIEPTIAKNIIPLLLVSVGFGLIGFIDDFKKVILRNGRFAYCSSRLYNLFNKRFTYRNRYIHTIHKNKHYFTNLVLHSICYFCYASNNECY